MFKKILKYCLLPVLFLILSSQTSNKPVFWHEEIIKSMTLDQKIGQLFMVAAYSNKENSHTVEIENLIHNYHIGGLIFFQNNPKKQVYLTNYYQSISKTPLMIGMDAEWGVAMRLSNVQKMPYHMTLGAVQNDTLIYETSAAIARQCKRLGVHINFAPVLDINNNKNNPIIGFRSFGDDKYNVLRVAKAFSDGMMSENVLSCMKHFPGHGDVQTDSHLDMPIVNKSYEQIDTLELFPFKEMSKHGIPSVMVAHIQYPEIDNKANRPSSLSKIWVDSILKKKMGYDGLVFTDALNMKGASKHFSPGYIDLEACLAGNDVLLFSENVPVAHQLIKSKIIDGSISENELDKRVLKILKWKEKVGLNNYTPIKTNDLMNDLNKEANSSLMSKVAENAVCFSSKSFNFKELKKEETAAVFISNNFIETYTKQIKMYVKETYKISKNADTKEVSSLLLKLKNYKNVIISYHEPKVWSQQTNGMTAADFKLINDIGTKKNTVFIGFCTPYVMDKINREKVTTICGFEDSYPFHKAALDLLNNNISQKAVLPIKLSQIYIKNRFSEIDNLAEEIIRVKAAPGCRILAIKDNEILYDGAFGHLTYEKKETVSENTIYDLASMTKILSTTLCLMKLYDEGKFDYTKKLGDYLPETKGTNKENLIIKEILTHQSGLVAWIPFYKSTLPNYDICYAKEIDSNRTVLVCNKFYGLTSLKDSIYKQILESPLQPRSYKYSDLGLIFMQKIIEKITGQTLDNYVLENFYKPLNLKYTFYNPLQHQVPLSQIAPTQDDRLFRQQVVRGYVHDPAAAMLGGVAGHAGLFSDVYGVAEIMKMLLNDGKYNGKSFIKPETIKLFTSYQYLGSRRGLGFDKPDFSGKTSPASTLGSTLMFGHTGFTGTCVWADPKSNLIFVFLSNRTYPDEENKTLINNSYRIKIQDILYRSIQN